MVQMRGGHGAREGEEAEGMDLTGVRGQLDSTWEGGRWTQGEPSQSSMEHHVPFLLLTPQPHLYLPRSHVRLCLAVLMASWLP